MLMYIHHVVSDSRVVTLQIVDFIYVAATAIWTDTSMGCILYRLK